MLRAGGAVVFALTLVACSPDRIAADVTVRTARTVVLPVVKTVIPPPADTLATDCLLANATNAELNLLARNIGNSAGTLTVQTIRDIAARPAAQACIAGKGLAPLVL